MFVGQTIDLSGSKAEYVMSVNTFAKESSVTGATIFVAITEQLTGSYITKIVSATADIIAVHTGRKSGVSA